MFEKIMSAIGKFACEHPKATIGFAFCTLAGTVVTVNNAISSLKSPLQETVKNLSIDIISTSDSCRKNDIKFNVKNSEENQLRDVDEEDS